MDALLRNHLNRSGIESLFTNDVQQRKDKTFWEKVLESINQIFSIAANSITAESRKKSQ